MKLAVILALVTAPAFATELPPDLAQAVRDYDRAQVDNDTATLGRLVEDDYVLVNSDASVENKQQFLADFHLPGFKIDPYTLKEPIHKVWNDGAVIGGLLDLSWTQDGRHQTRRLRVSYVWAKRDGHWRATYAQVPRVVSQVPTPKPGRTDPLNRAAAPAIGPQSLLSP
ncbi:nuclear transport factor 2 family protein [Lysobacter sp. CA199]|uniref:nuclear transport factor 2 family protein n=1 Tax=Lysobacter sp. CA199 TaxID=3455608 RepID=UPI003F8D66AB